MEVSSKSQGQPTKTMSFSTLFPFVSIPHVEVQQKIKDSYIEFLLCDPGYSDYPPKIRRVASKVDGKTHTQTYICRSVRLLLCLRQKLVE